MSAGPKFAAAPRAPHLFAAAMVAVAALVPVLVNRQDIWNIAFLVCLYITLGQSWNVLAGFAGQMSLGHAALFGVGALVTRTLWLAGTPFALALTAGGLAALVFGSCIGAPTFRLRGAYFAIATLGVAEVLRIYVSQNRPLISTLSGPMIAAYDQAAPYYLALALAVASSAASFLLLRSRWSLGILALRDDEQAAEATGVDVFLHKMLAMGLSSMLAGLAGGVFAYQQISYYPSAPFGIGWSFDALLVTFLGGLGTLTGPVIGAVFFVLVRQALALTLPEVHQVVFGVLFVVIVLVLPGGLVGTWQRVRGALRKTQPAPRSRI